MRAGLHLLLLKGVWQDRQEFFSGTAGMAIIMQKISIGIWAHMGEIDGIIQTDETGAFCG